MQSKGTAGAARIQRTGERRAEGMQLRICASLIGAATAADSRQQADSSCALLPTAFETAARLRLPACRGLNSAPSSARRSDLSSALIHAQTG